MQINSQFGKTHENSLRILAVLTEHEALDKTVKSILQLCLIVISVDNITIVLQVNLRLRSQFASKILRGIYKSINKPIDNQSTHTRAVD